MNKIIEPNHRTESNGIYVTDIMHVFKADNLAFQLERGQQKKMDITFVRNSQNTTCTISLPKISLADHV